MTANPTDPHILTPVEAVEAVQSCVDQVNLLLDENRELREQIAELRLALALAVKVKYERVWASDGDEMRHFLRPECLICKETADKMKGIGYVCEPCRHHVMDDEVTVVKPLDPGQAAALKEAQKLMIRRRNERAPREMTAKAINRLEAAKEKIREQRKDRAAGDREHKALGGSGDHPDG